MRKSYDSKFKSRVALEAMRGELTIAEIASKYQIHPNQVQRWKQRLMEGATDIFASSSERKAARKAPRNSSWGLRNGRPSRRRCTRRTI